MRILFTSVGRRVELMQAFRTAADKLNIDFKSTFIGNDNTGTPIYHALEDYFGSASDDDFNDFCELDGTLEPYLETLAKLLEENTEI